MIAPADFVPGRVYRVEFAYTHRGEVFRYDMRAIFLGLDGTQVPTWATTTAAERRQFLAIPKEWVTLLEEARNKPPYLRRIHEHQRHA